MSIVLDKPVQINAWVLMSRISQCHMHMAGYPVKGLAAWLKRNIPDCAGLATVKSMYPRLLDFCDEYGVSAPGGEQCHYQILVRPKSVNVYGDQGVFATMEEVSERFATLYDEGRVVILRTMDEPREPDARIVMQMR